MLEKFYRFHDVSGINVHIQPDGEPLIAACRVTSNGRQLVIGNKKKETPALEAITKDLNKGTLVALNITGKGVVTKRIPKVNHLDHQVLNSMMPNAVLDDLYLQNFISGDFSFVSFIRKAEADKWINRITNLDGRVVLFSLGAFPVAHILPQLNTYGEQLIFNGHQIEWSENKEWLAYTYNETHKAAYAIKVENETLEEQFLLPYAAAFQAVLADRLEPVKAGVPFVNQSFRETVSTSKLKAQGVVILVVLFLLLLINLFVFSSLTRQNSKLAEQVSTSAQSSTDWQKLSDDIKVKEAILDTLGWNAGKSKAFYIDQIASLMPEEVTCTRIAVNPSQITTGSSADHLKFLTGSMVIIGVSDKVLPVNEWMARIKTKSWVKQIHLADYNYNPELNTGQFTIAINY